MRPVVLLDRDGTINVDRGFVARIDQWELVPGAIEGLRTLRAAGFALAVITNQSGIARGYYTTEDLARLHEHMTAVLRAEGVELDAVAFCPHGPEENCGCRKPRTGMARQIEAQLGDSIDAAASWTVGDKPADIGFGAALGTSNILIESRYWTPDDLQVEPTFVTASLLEAARRIVEESP